LKIVGLVIEIEEKKTLVVTADYKYYIIKSRPDMKIGEYIHFVEKDNYNSIAKKRQLLSIVAALIIIIISTFSYYIIQKVNNNIYAYIGIDSNKSIETIIKIKKNYKVITINKTSKSKEIISENLENTVLSRLDNFSSKYIKTKNEEIIVTIYLKSEKNEYICSKKLMNRIKNRIDNSKIENPILLVQMCKNSRELAIKNNLSMGRFFLYKLSIKNNINLSINDVNKQNINSLTKLLNSRNNLCKKYEVNSSEVTNSEDKKLETVTAIATITNKAATTIKPTINPSPTINPAQTIKPTLSTKTFEKTELKTHDDDSDGDDDKDDD
jgi:hypothetical protein